ncbi:Chromatin structure-remodeling complex subunit rsc1, partial [Zancudomyces culisetae]
MMGGTALIWAAYGGHPNGLRRLLFEGNADVKVVNNLGQAPIDVVPNPENSKWKELLSADSRPTPRKRGGPKNTTRSSRTANMQAEDMAPTQTQTQTQTQMQMQMQMQMQTQSYTEVQPQAQQAELQSQVVTTQLPDEVRWGELSDKERAAVVSKGFPDIHAIVGCLEAVLQYKNEEDEEIAEVFEDLPDQEEYPEYYQIFKKPISLGVIANKVVQGQYTGFGQFDADMLTVFNNACFFNTHGSEIYANSVTLMGVYFTTRKTLVEKYGIKFDLALAEAKPAKGRYVTRIMNGELDIGVGDCVEAVSEDGTKRVAIVLRLSVSGPRDRVQHMDGMWFRHPKDTAMSQHNLAYPHELVLDTTLFTGHPVKFVQKRVAVLPLSAYIHYYPAGFEKSELYVCEYALTSNSVLAQLSSWPTPSPMPQPAEHRLNLVPQPQLKLVRLPLELWAITTSAAIASRITMLAPQSVGIAPSTTGAAFSQRKPLTQAVHNVTTMQPVAVGNSNRPSSLPTTRAAMLMKHQQQQAQQQAQQQTTPQLHQTAGSYLQPHQPSAQLYANTGQSVVTHVSAFPHARPHPHTNLVKPDSFP